MKRFLVQNGLTLFFLTILLLALVGQSVAGRADYNEQQLGQLQQPVSWLGYVTSADFWSRTPAELAVGVLAVAAMASFVVYLRQRGSPESKPVGAPHDSTGSEE